MPKPHWRNDEVDLLKSNYGVVETSALAKLLPLRCQHAIHQKASRLGLVGDRRRPSTKYRRTDHNYFARSGVHTPYWAGLIAADGCVHGGKMLQLFQSDEGVIRRFAEAVCYDGPIRHKSSPLSGRPNYSVTIYSRQMVADLLSRYGIGPAKSLTLQPPAQLGRENALAFITGYLDGDGSICLVNGKLTMSVVGTQPFLQWVGRTLGGGRIRKKPKTTGRVVGKNDVWCLQATGSVAGRMLGELMSVSELAGLRMARKWDKVLEWRSNGHQPAGAGQ
jgi:hypothetical protein